MADLRDLAYQQLSKATVRIEGPYPWTGGVWNAGEFAWFKVTLTNTTGLPLRNTTLVLKGDNAAQVLYGYPAGYYGFWGGNLDPNLSVSFYTAVYATKAGSAHIYASIAGETVPYTVNPCIKERELIAVTPA
jgi:hypothetical protein